jgi:cobalt-zinc-cadmium efflux system outer membrane protein
MHSRRRRTQWPALLLAVAASCLIAVCHAPRVLAQDTTSRAGGQLRLGEVFRVLETASPRLEAARQSALAAEERIAPARTLPDPQLQFGLMNRSLPGLGLQQPLGMNQIQLMQMVPLAGKLGLAGRVARAQAKGTRARASDLGWDLRARAAMAFYELYQIEQSLAVAVETQRLLQDIAKTVETMYGVGSGRQADVLRAQVEVARMGEDILRMRAMRDAAGARLNALLDRPQEAQLAPPAIPVFPADLPSLDSLERLALANRPMIEAGRRDVEAAVAQARLARREIWPDLQVGLQYGQQPMPGGGTDRMMSFMLGFSLPIFAGGRQLPMRREAAAMRLMAEADLDAMRAETRGRLGELYADVGRARRLSALYRGTIIPQAEATVASALAAYRVGGVDFMTLLDDQMTVNRYRQALYQLEAEHGQALAEVEMLVGQALLDPDTAESPSGGNK